MECIAWLKRGSWEWKRYKRYNSQSTRHQIKYCRCLKRKSGITRRSTRTRKSGAPVNSAFGLDNLFGGGLPEFSFNLIAGTPGSGRITLANQMMFSLATPDKHALFFTVLGEPPLKMLRYQQQFSFFDIDKINDSVRFVNLSVDLISGNFDGVLARIANEVEVYAPSLVFVDSFRSVVHSAKREGQSAFDLQHFIQQLGMQMTSWQATPLFNRRIFAARGRG